MKKGSHLADGSPAELPPGVAGDQHLLADVGDLGGVDLGQGLREG